MYPKVLLAKKRCTEALKTYPKRIETYKNLTLIPLKDTMCVYDTSLHIFAV